MILYIEKIIYTHMGKKKPQKTKELSVAIAEASSTGDESQQQQPQLQTPRRRGRPRKIFQATAGEDGEGSQSKKAKTDQLEELNTEEPVPISAAPAAIEGSSINTAKRGEGQSEEKKLVRELSSRSKASRKSKPRKSS